MIYFFQHGYRKTLENMYFDLKNLFSTYFHPKNQKQHPKNFNKPTSNP
jgi:hypothetical protein